MTSRGDMRKEIFSLFGTPFEELEEKEAASKRPLSIENQVVTDEKGRRRFHGAFTGGFSAGYFNTVGTKEGWAPSTFKSSRSQREELSGRRPEDFMDTEDLGEYGIAPRRIQTTQQFRENAESSTAPKKRFAGEAIAELEAVADRLSDLIKPVSDSIGVQLMRSMGWRPGKGVGAEESVLMRERRAEAKVYGCEMPPGAGDVHVESAGLVESTSSAELETMAPGFRFAPTDVDFVTFEPKKNLHGLGYKGLDTERFLASKRTEKSVALKTHASQKKGIKGQAFGVGAFEDDDEDVYVTEDISKYDYALGGNELHQKQAAVSGDFIPATTSQPPRKFFPAPKLSRDYTPSVPATREKAKTEQGIDKEGKGIDKEEKRIDKEARQTDPVGLQTRSKNAVERANVMGESVSIWSLVSEKDRQRIEAVKAGKPVHSERQEPMVKSTEQGQEPVLKSEKGRQEPVVKTEKQRPQDVKIAGDGAVPFTNDSGKKSRYQDFLNYVKRGICPSKPSGMTEWDWEIEQTEFRKHLPSDLVAMEVDSRTQLQPLAGHRIASAFSSTFKSKFTTGAYAEEEQTSEQNREDEDKVKAVQMKMFGPMTREKHEWHPERNLCKRFNVPNPYPDSRVTGVPHLKRDTKPEFFSLNFAAPTAASVVKESAEAKTNSAEKEYSKTTVKEEVVDSPMDATEPSSSLHIPPEEEPEKPPMSLFKAVFAQTSSSSSDEEIEEYKTQTVTSREEARPAQFTSSRKWTPPIMEETAATSGFSNAKEDKGKRDTVEIQIEEDNDIVEIKQETISVVHVDPYGPALPPDIPTISLPPTSVISRHKKKSRHRHRRDEKKPKKKSREEKKHRKHKKHRSRHSSSDESTESGSQTGG